MSRMKDLEIEAAEVQDQQPPITVQATGEDGNIFSIMGRTARALKRDGQYEQATEMTARVAKANSYDEALQIIMEYVDLV